MLDVLVPVVSDGTHVAELARDRISLDERLTRNDTGFPSSVTVRTVERMFIQTIETAVFTTSSGQAFFRAIHVHFKDPIADFITLSGGQEIFLGESNLIRRRNISFFEVLVVRDSVVFGVFDGIIQIDVSVEEDVGHIVVTCSSVGISGIEEGLVSSDVFRVSEQGCGQGCCNTRDVSAAAFTLEKEQVDNSQVLVELMVVSVPGSLFEVLNQLLEHLFQDLHFDLVCGSENFNGNCLVNREHLWDCRNVEASENSSSFLELTLLEMSL